MTVAVPAALKLLLRPLPQWPPVALHEPQAAVSVLLSTAELERDVTRTIVVASLRPLTLGLGLDTRLTAALEAQQPVLLRFVDLESRRTVGTLYLQHVRNWCTSGIDIGLFEVDHGAQRCVEWPLRPWNRWLQNRRQRRKTDPNNFSMPPEAVQQQMIFYICPRPVVLVSVDDGTHSNLFPMDLIGPVAPECFTLALRSTSPSIATMRTGRRVALSDVRARDYGIAYQLGVHHRSLQIDWDRLPFALRRSAQFNLPCPEIALRVRELAILDWCVIGSHTFFVTRIASEQAACGDPQFFHTSGIYQHFRARRGRPFPSCG